MYGRIVGKEDKGLKDKQGMAQRVVICGVKDGEIAKRLGRSLPSIRLDGCSQSFIRLDGVIRPGFSHSSLEECSGFGQVCSSSFPKELSDSP